MLGKKSISAARSKESRKWKKKLIHIKHASLNHLEEYLTGNKLTNKGKSLLFNLSLRLRSKSENLLKDNLHKMYQNTTFPMCGKDVDIQSHALANCSTTLHQRRKQKS